MTIESVVGVTFEIELFISKDALYFREDTL